MEHLDRIERKTIENVSENGPRPENHTHRYNVQPDHDGMNLQNIKLEAPTFGAQLDPQIFLDWTSDMIIILISIMSDETRNSICQNEIG